MMQGADMVAVSPAGAWRVLSRAGLLRKWSGKPSKKETGFEQPPQPHQHWHIDLSYLNVRVTFYYLCSILDGYSFLVHSDLRESMTEADIEVILERPRSGTRGLGRESTTHSEVTFRAMCSLASRVLYQQFSS